MPGCHPAPRQWFLAALPLLWALRLTASAAQPEPLWAYGFATEPRPGQHFTLPAAPPPANRVDPPSPPLHVPGSTVSFSYEKIHQGLDVIDWFPGDHPPMTPVMRQGPAHAGAWTYGCAYCHLPNGEGRPENAPTAGLSAGYILRQLQDFASGARRSADARKPNTLVMAALAAAMTEAEMRDAAAYFAALPWKPRVQVIETDRVPKTKIEGNLFIALSPDRTEPIAGRIIEVPADEEQSEVLRNPRSGFIAYVPPGAVARGARLATAATATACATCHGPKLAGQADFPGIAGRSPSYLARQLYDFQRGTRKGPMSVLMQPVVANLKPEDLTALVAYVASL